VLPRLTLWAGAGAAVSDNTESIVSEGASAQQMSLSKALLISIRPKQWSKNGLLFLGLVFSHSLAHPALLSRASLAFLDFCLLASATYLINDLLDAEKDRQHPIKCKRPIASGRISPSLAATTSAVLLIVSLGLAVALGGPYLVSAGLYILLTVTYSVWLKHIVILDVLAVAAGFVIRAAAGAVVIGVPISPWLYVCTMLGALFLVFCKRRHEMVLLEASAASHRRILEEYSIPLLDQMISVVTSATVIAYSLYTFSAENLPRNSAMMLTIPFLLYGIFRYLYLIHVRGVGGSPEELLLTDRPLMATVFGWGVLSTLILYLVH
jgi:4-hydroxybenzoate polyprenyltransferase